MSKFIVAVVLLASVAAAAVEKPCVEKPCTREYIPVSVIDSNQNCIEFPNMCYLENAIRCGRVDPNVSCIQGTCRSRGAAFPCPVAED